MVGRLSRILSLKAGSILLLKGRATARCKGRVTILGMDVDGREVNVRHGKTLPLEAHGPATVSLSIEEGDGGYSIVDKDSSRCRVGTGIWQEVIDAIKDSKPKSIMLVGATDTGKSTLATYISNIAVAERLAVGIVDSDIGQGDIAPPACMGSCMVREQVLDLRDLKADEYYFIGRIAPAGVEDHIIRGVMHLINSLHADMVIVNTDGYVNEQGLRYKARMAEDVDADMVVMLGDIDYNRMNIFKARVVVVVRVDTSSSIQKSRGERIARRIEQYKRFLAGGREVRFRTKSKEFVMLCRRAMLMHSSMVVDDTLIIPSDMLSGMFVALAMMDRVMGFAILDRVEGSIATMITNYEGEFDTVMLSSIRLTRDMSMEHRLDLI
ncbi:MAG: Clp1/GlmU family protein [Candidatus Nitrosocaldus sp.]